MVLDLSLPELFADGAPPFVTARECKAWLAEPFGEPAERHLPLLVALDGLARVDIEAYERLKILELVRGPVREAQSALLAPLLDGPLPLDGETAAQFDAASGLWRRLEAGYRLCLAAALQGDLDTGEHLALILQRLLLYVGQQMLVARLAGTAPGPRLWRELHGLMVSAEARMVAEQLIKDSLEGTAGYTCPRDAYFRAVLAQAADASWLSGHELLAIDGLLRRQAVKVEFCAPPALAGAPPRWLDMASPGGLQTLPDEPPPGARFVGVAALANALAWRIRALAQGQTPVDVHLPERFARRPAEALLHRVYSAWCGTPRPAPNPLCVPCEVATGLDALCALAGGPQPVESERAVAMRIAIFGHAPSTRADAPAQTERPESWSTVAEGNGVIVVARPDDSQLRLRRGQLLGVRLSRGGGWAVAVVRALSMGAELEVEAALFPGRAAPVAWRWPEAARDGPSGVAFQLRDEAGMSLLVAPGAFARGRLIDCGRAGRVRMASLIERGIDFEHVVCRPV